jgi:exosortase/archaeosortase family protein
MTDVLTRTLDRYRLPVGPLRFLLRAMVMAVVWKAAYVLLMRPSGIPDRWMVRQLGASTAWLLDRTGSAEVHARHTLQPTGGEERLLEPASMIYVDGRAMLSIHAPCNGLDLMVLAAGFVLCYPGTWRRRAVFVPLCLVAVALMNIMRCGLLCAVRLGMPEQFDFLHKFLFNLVAYACVFLLWTAYAGPGVLRRGGVAGRPS